MCEVYSNGTDVLQLFRQDIDLPERVRAFEFAYGQIKTEVDRIATPENIHLINSSYTTTLVLNSHGGGIHAGQSLRHVKQPFITFVENAGDRDISDGAEKTLFGVSLQNAFDVTFNGSSPLAPYPPSAGTNLWGYWRDRGLLEKGSLVVPIDIRHYSLRLLDALIGDDYDQDYLNSGITIDELRAKDYDTLVHEQTNKGLLITHSNALRELTSTKQILQTLLIGLNPGETSGLDASSVDKLMSLRDKRMRDNDGKIPIYVLYGTAHHSIFHALKNYGIDSTRIFAGKEDLPGAMAYVGTTKDQFFSAHPFNLPEETFRKYAKEHILESILRCPINYWGEYGLVPASQTMVGLMWLKISRLARKNNLVDDLEQIVNNFKADKNVPVNILREHGIELRHIGE